MPYSIPYLLLSLFYLGIWHFEKRGKNVSLLCSLTFILFYAFRGFVAWDWLSYYTRFNLPLEFIPEVYPLEQGFAYFCMTIKAIIDDYHVFVFVSSMVDLYLLNKILSRYSKGNLSLMFFFFVVFYTSAEMDLMRNIKSILLFYYSLEYVRKKKIICFWLLNLLGLSFHSSSIIFLLLGLFIFRSWNRKIILLLFIIGNVLFLQQEGIFTLLFQKLAGYIDIGIYEVIYEGYANSDKYSSQYGISFGYIERTLSFILIYKNYKRILETDERMLPLVNIFYVFIFINLFFSDFMIVIDRGGMLFRFSYILLCPSLYNSINFIPLKKCYLYFIVIFSLTRLHVFTNNVFYDYENILFGAKTYIERKSIIEKYIDVDE